MSSKNFYSDFVQPRKLFPVNVRNESPFQDCTEDCRFLVAQVHLSIESGSSFHALTGSTDSSGSGFAQDLSHFHPDITDHFCQLKLRIRKHAPPSTPPPLLSPPPSPCGLRRMTAWVFWIKHAHCDCTSQALQSFSRRVHIGCLTALAFREGLASPESCKCGERHEVKQENSPGTAAAGGGGAEAVVKRSRSWSKGNRKVEADGERWRLKYKVSCGRVTLGALPLVQERFLK